MRGYLPSCSPIFAVAKFLLQRIPIDAGGRGRDVMTVLGAIGGAVAGHQIEKNVKKVKSYEIAVRLDDGSTQFITQDKPPAWRSGDRVRLVDGVITASNGY